MGTLVVALRASQALIVPSVMIASVVNEANPPERIALQLEDVEKLETGNGAVLQLTLSGQSPVYGGEAAAQVLLSSYPSLRGSNSVMPLEDEWIKKVPNFYPLDFKAVDPPLLELDAHLTLRSHIVGHFLSVADLVIWGVLRGNRVAAAAIKKGTYVNVTRWYNYIQEMCPWTVGVMEELNAQAAKKKAQRSKEGGNYDIALKDTDKGVLTRFPPEPSGYLHIGHAKAALLNDYFAHEKYKGTLLVRFDDTNPSKEKAEFQDAILEDLSLMGIKPDRTSYSSDYFDELYNYCVQMIKGGNAYADDTDQDTMRQQRMDGIPSKRRDAGVEENLAHFEEMKKGTEEGKRWCVRAKISVDNPNKALRDPVIYRCNDIPHHRTGSKWKVYPTYDFCCPILDSFEGVTHALRTIEYRDRNPQYDWMINALKLRPVYIWDFARMNFVRTLLSKRKLTKFVEQGVVWGWDDPRFPTIRGVRRRGMTIPALREFILKQGPSRNIVNLDWAAFWATNKSYIDPVAPRHTAIEKKDIVTVTIRGARAASYSEEKPKHAKNPSVGTKKVVYSNTILIEQEDAKSFDKDEEITLMNWGNAIVRKISTGLNPLSSTVKELELELHLEGDFKKTKKKVTWLSVQDQELTPVELVDFDYLITKDKLDEGDEVDDFLTEKTEFRTEALADCNVAECEADDIIQFERKGFFRIDRAFAHGKPAVAFNIPTGRR